MNIVILDDYQDAVRKLRCASMLDPYTAKVYTNNVKGIGQLAVRLRDADIIVLIHERTQITRQLVEKLPRLKLIAQAGRVGEHIDVAACTERGIAVADGVSSPVAPAELTWALIMAAMRRLPQYIANLKHGAWQQSGLKTTSMPPNFGLGLVLRGKMLGIWGYGQVGRLVAGYGRAFGMNVSIWGPEAERAQALADGYQAASSRAEFLAQCDVLSLHLRLADATRAPCSRSNDLSCIEAHGAAREHRARGADRARRAACRAQPRPPRHGRDRRVRKRTYPAGPRAAAPGKLHLHAAYRLRGARQLRALLQRRLRQRGELHPGQAQQHHRPRGAAGAALKGPRGLGT